MSTDASAIMQAVSRVAGLSLAALAALSASAAEVRFRPSMSFGIFHEGNLNIIGESTQGGDDVANAAADLAVERTTQSSSMTFSYRPSYVAYSEASDLNYFGQSADFNYSTTPSRSSTYSVNANAYRTDRQGVRPTDAATPVSFIARNTTTAFAGTFHGSHQGRRNAVDWDIHGGLNNYDVIEEQTGPPPLTCIFGDPDRGCNDGDSCTTDTCLPDGTCEYVPSPDPLCEERTSLQNSQTVGVLAAWRYLVSPKASIGLGVVLDTIFYESLPDATVGSLGVVGAYQFSRVTSMSYAGGVAVTTSDGVNDANFAANVAISRTLTDVSSLSAGLRQAVSQGSGVGGVSLDSGAYVAYTHNAPRPGLTGSITAGYWRRDPVNVPGSTVENTTTLSAVGSIGWIFNRYLSLHMTDSYSYQTSSLSAFDTQYNSYGVNLRWDILGREARESGGAREGRSGL